MKTEDITFVFKILQSLKNNQGLVMDNNKQSIAVIKREDKQGIYYSINDTINNIPQKVNHNECAMTLLLTNADRFKYPVYNSKISNFK
jgi:hypothetical protein